MGTIVLNTKANLLKSHRSGAGLDEKHTAVMESDVMDCFALLTNTPLKASAAKPRKRIDSLYARAAENQLLILSLRRQFSETPLEPLSRRLCNFDNLMQK